MIPIDQTIIGYRQGNCFAACVASLLELKLEDLPKVETTKADQWCRVWIEWGKDHNIDFVILQSVPFWKPKGYSLAGIESPREDVRKAGVAHSVVAYNGKIVHDPHPNKDGYQQKILDWILLVPLDPRKPMGVKL